MKASLAVVVAPLLLAVILSGSTNNVVVVVTAFVVTTAQPHAVKATTKRTDAVTYYNWPSSSSFSTFLTAVNNKDNKSNNNDSSGDIEMFSNIKGMVSNFDFSSITTKGGGFDMSSLTDKFSDITNNLSSGEFGKRGEAYVAAQAVLLLCIALGGIPLVGGMVSLLLGPGLLLVGLATMAVSLPALGPNLSPWPVPPSSNTAYLVTDEGLYAQMRHPLYAGLLATCTGLSIVTGSPTRLLLTAFLLYVLDLKSDFEEEELAQKFPGQYDEYKKNVTGKFFPKFMAQVMPRLSSSSNQE